MIAFYIRKAIQGKLTRYEGKMQSGLHVLVCSKPAFHNVCSVFVNEFSPVFVVFFDYSGCIYR